MLYDMTYYGYCRKSTEGQNETSFQAQDNFLRSQANLLHMDYMPIYETGSGKSIEGRIQFLNLLSRLCEGDVIGVYDSSRLSRNIDDTPLIASTLKEKKARLQVGGQFLNLQNPQDKLTYNINASMNTYQREKIVERAVMGLEIYRKNGDYVFPGNLIGYTLSRSRGRVTATIDETPAQYISYIFKEYSNGRSVSSLISELEDVRLKDFPTFRFDSKRIRALIRKPIYMGFYVTDANLKLSSLTKEGLKKQLIRSNVYPPIIDEETWWKCFEHWRTNTREQTDEYSYRYVRHELSGIFKCPTCECRAGYHKASPYKGVQKTYYAIARHSIHCPKNDIFPLYLEWVLVMVVRATFFITFSNGSEVGAFFEDKKSLAIQDIESLQRQLEEINVRIKNIEKQEEKIADILLNMENINYSLYDSKLAKLKSEKDELNSFKLRLDESVMRKQDDIEEVLRLSTTDLVEEFIHCEDMARRDILAKVIKEATFNDNEGNISIEYMNGKRFDVFLYKPKSKEKDIDISTMDISFKGEYQNRYLLSLKKKQIHIPRVTENEWSDWLNENIEKEEVKINQRLEQTY